MQWSLRLMTRASGCPPSTSHRIWQAFDLQPHRSESFKLSSNSIHRSARSCCASIRRARSRRWIAPARLVPMRPVQVGQCTHNCMRHGGTTLFAALDVKLVMDNDTNQPGRVPGCGAGNVEASGLAAPMMSRSTSARTYEEFRVSPIITGHSTFESLETVMTKIFNVEVLTTVFVKISVVRQVVRHALHEDNRQ